MALFVWICSGGAADSVVSEDLVTDPSINNVFGRPVEQTEPLPTGVTILAQ